MKQKLVLFDVDGTILSSKGLGKKAFAAALKDTVGNNFSDDINMAGKTDTQILYEALENFYDKKQIQKLIMPIYEAYIHYLPLIYKKENGVKLINGADSLVKNIAENENITLGLLTGNIKKGAEIKLEVYNLYNYFLFGAFGDEVLYRNELPDIAVKRAYEMFDLQFYEKDVVIIGDTVNDILCGRHLNVKTIIILSKKYMEDEIIKNNPDYIFNDFTDQDEIIESIFE